VPVGCYELKKFILQCGASNWKIIVSKCLNILKIFQKLHATIMSNEFLDKGIRRAASKCRPGAYQWGTRVQSD
jgi:hypothetical protein